MICNIFQYGCLRFYKCLWLLTIQGIKDSIKKISFWATDAYQAELTAGATQIGMRFEDKERCSFRIFRSGKGEEKQGAIEGDDWQSGLCAK